MERWINTLGTLIEKQKEYNTYVEKDKAYVKFSWWRKLLTKKPACELTQLSLVSLAKEYTEAFNQHFDIGRRLETVDGLITRHIAIYYNGETLMPVLAITVFCYGTIYQSRLAFDSNGDYVEWGIEYPCSESGVTINTYYVEYLSKYPQLKEYIEYFDKLKNTIQEQLKTLSR